MEAALASVALTGNVVQFITVARSILHKGYELKRSHDGKLKEHKDILTVIDSLDKWMSQLKVGSDDTLEPMIDACKDIAAKLKDALSRASATRGIWSHYREALKFVWNKKELEATEQQLSRLVDGISYHVQATISRDVTATLEYGKVTEHNLSHVDARLHDLARNHTRSVDELKQTIEVSTNQIVYQFQNSSITPEALCVDISKLRRLCEQFLAGVSEIRRTLNVVPASSNEPEFIECFRFWKMDDREDSISKAHARTYEWIIMDPDENAGPQREGTYGQERLELRSHLLRTFSEIGLGQDIEKYPFQSNISDSNPTAHLQHWFQAGRGVFWIWGKPGCGKSTLMKAMMKNPTLKKRLKLLLDSEHSRKDTKTVIASFYFFRPGMSLQKSQIGFLQSLLYQILRHRRHLIDKVFSKSEQAQAKARFENLAGSDTPVWSLSRLKSAFAQIRALDNTKFYLHVDGIDEIESKPIEIAKLLCELAAYSNIQILAAGRYHGEFKQTFPEDQALNLHELTEMDILRYAVDNLRQPQLLKLIRRRQQFIEIIKEITRSAQGVFQWVYIVVDSLLEGSYKFETFQDLFNRLKEYPKDLHELYQFLYSSIDSRYLEANAFWLLSVLEFTADPKLIGERAVRRLTTIDVWLAEQLSARNADCCKDLHRMKARQRNRLARDTQLRIQAQGRHFFDFGPRSEKVKNLSFAHRTVLDFLMTEDRKVAKQLQSRISTNWDHTLLAWAIVKDGPEKGHIYDPRLLNYKVAAVMNVIPKIRFDRVQPMWAWLKSVRIHPGKDDDEYHAQFSDYFATTNKWVSLAGKDKTNHLRWLERKMPSPLFFVATLHCFKEIPASLVQYIERLNLDKDDLELLLLAILNSVKTGINGSVWTDSIAKYVLHLFPDGVPYQSACLSRLLEWLRLFITGEKSPKFGDRYFWKHIPLVVSVIRQLVSSGANPNMLCKSVSTDTNKSHISVLGVIDQVSKYWTEVEKGTIQDCISIVQMKGGRVSEVPFSEHQEPDVGPELSELGTLISKNEPL